MKITPLAKLVGFTALGVAVLTGVAHTGWIPKPKVMATVVQPPKVEEPVVVTQHGYRVSEQMDSKGLNIVITTPQPMGPYLVPIMVPPMFMMLR